MDLALNRGEVLLPTAAVMAGATAWCGPLWAIGLAALLPALWAAAPTRQTAAFVVLAYQLAATSGAPAAIIHYFRTVFGVGVALWVLAGLVITTGWAACWHPSAPRRRGFVPVALALTAAPPLGIVGWVHPLTSAGVLFPSWGWLGLSAVMALMIGVSCLPARLLPFAGAGILLWAQLTSGQPAAAPGWRGVDTHGGSNPGHPDLVRDYERQLVLIDLARMVQSDVLLLPESAGGLWTPYTTLLWTTHLAATKGRTVLLGCEIAESDGSSTNALVAIEESGAKTVYRQRMPVPLSMWRPWSRTGTRAYWFQNPVVSIHDCRAAVFICHDQILVWPVLHSFLHDPDLVLACSNAWWAVGTTIPAIQRNSIIAWARLFNRPCVIATNL